MWPETGAPCPAGETHCHTSQYALKGYNRGTEVSARCPLIIRALFGAIREGFSEEVKAGHPGVASTSPGARLSSRRPCCIAVCTREDCNREVSSGYRITALFFNQWPLKTGSERSEVGIRRFTGAAVSRPRVLRTGRSSLHIPRRRPSAPARLSGRDPVKSLARCRHRGGGELRPDLRERVRRQAQN